MELGTLEYFRDQNQIQTLAVLGGCLVVAFNAITKEYQVIMHNHSSAYWTVTSEHTMPSEFSEHAHNAVRVLKCLWQVSHPPDSEGNHGGHSMVNGKGDINYTLWDSSVGKALYRMGKHGTRTRESYKGTVISTNYVRQQIIHGHATCLLMPSVISLAGYRCRGVSVEVQTK